MSQVKERKYVYEIDMLDALKQCLLQWRAMLAVALVCAIAFSGIQYAKEMQTAKQAVANTLEKASDKTEEKQKVTDLKSLEAKAKVARLNLASDEAAIVDTALSNEKYMLQMNDYMDSSLLMRIDPYNKHVLNLQYYIEGISPEKATILCEAYKRQLTKGTYVEDLGAALGCPKETDDRYIRELFEVWYSGASQIDSQVTVVPILSIQLIIPDGVSGVPESNTDDCISSIDESLSSLQAELTESIGKHSISRISAFSTEEVDLELRSKIATNKSYIVNTQQQLRTDYASFSDDQKAVFDAGVASLEREFGYSHRLTADNQEDTDATVKEEEVNSVIEQPSFSLKYFIIGLIVGIIFYICIYLLTLIICGRVVTADELSTFLDHPLFGQSHSFDGRARNRVQKALIDRKIFCCLYRDSLESNEGLAAQTAERIAVEAKFENVKKISFLSLEEEQATVSGFVRKVERSLAVAGNGFETVMITASPEKLSMDIDILSSCSIVLVGQRALTRRKDVEDFLNLARRFNIQVMGCVFAE